MNYYNQIKDEIMNSEYLLIGIGEEMNFNFSNKLCDNIELIPFMKYTELMNADKSIYYKMYQNLSKLLNNKNYFIVSICNDGLIDQIKEIDKENVVKPCGGFEKLHCKNNCKNTLIDINQVEIPLINKLSKNQEVNLQDIPRCSVCNQPLVFNQVNQPGYDESEYLEDWNRYTTWLQKTLNKKILVLELGVGLEYPSVIRWPFEKIAYFNQKATFYRIHSKLFQVADELKGRTKTIASNPMDILTF